MLIERRALLRESLAIADSVTLAVSLVGAYAITNVAFGSRLGPFSIYAWLLLMIVPVWLMCQRAFGLYCSAAYVSVRRLSGRLVQMQCVASLLLLSSMYLTRSEAVSRLLLQTFLVVSFVALAAQKLALMACLRSVRRRRPTQRRKVLLVSTLESAETYLRLIREHTSMLADVVGILVPAMENCRVGWSGAPVILGTTEDLPAVLQGHVVDEVVIVSTVDRSTIERLTRWCWVRGMVARVLLELPPPTSGVWNATHLDKGAFLLSFAPIRQDALGALAKRVIDVFAAAVGLGCCGFAWAWYGVRLRREAGDSVLFRQQRVGRNGRRFTLYKFRTMCADAEERLTDLRKHNEMNGAIFKLKNDPRITPTGKKLRRRHLDELPQFWNVLRGDMSLVGTRPPTEDETAGYLNHHRRRLSIKPGLTGLWQITGNGTVNDFEEVVKLDCQYIDNWSLWLDLKIVAKTMTKMMRGDGW